MLQADVGILLRGLTEALAERVAPAVNDKGAADQLRAALHMIERLSRVWDLPPRLLREDNEDMRSTLQKLNVEILNAENESSRFAKEAVQCGFNDPELKKDFARNRTLRKQVEIAMAKIPALPVERQQSCVSELQGLIERMAQRDLILAGDVSVSNPANEDAGL